jgi:hypothetical protein
MRLIDADALIEEIKSLQVFVTGLRAGRGILNEYAKQYRESLLRIVEEQPTAYDVENVVAELEKLKQHNKELSEGAYLEDDKSFYFCAYTNFARAIGIVKRGGVE